MARVWWVGLVAAFGLGGAAAGQVRIEQIPGQGPLDGVEIHGVAAGAFDEAIWQAGTLHFVPDARSPLIAPRLAGVFRNIYAPSAVDVPDGWRVFYGAWDGVHTPNDRIYSLFTADFVDLGDRRTEIEHGEFTHVCNVNALRQNDGTFRMICTTYPDAHGGNKPACFVSPDGERWNGSPAPHAASRKDWIAINGYPGFEQADINGMNVLVHDPDGLRADAPAEGKADAYRLYFCDFKAGGHVYQAISADGREFRYVAPCLDSRHFVNDVRKFAGAGKPCYLMALHANTNALWYALSADGMRFGAEHRMAEPLGGDDRYIVAVGWVTKGERLLGFLYGAGPIPALTRNQIYARWLQKKLVFTDAGGKVTEATQALGPDRQILTLGRDAVEGTLEVFTEDGTTALCKPIPVKLTPQGMYRLVIPARR